LRFLIRFAIELTSNGDNQLNGKVLEGNNRRKKEENGNERKLYADALEENTAGCNNIFRSTILTHYQITGERG
jgi:hypothetical protein